MKHPIKILLVFLSIYFIFFIFFNLNWGAPFYFHPDERNIASSISQLNFPTNLNPHFFAYGQLPIYTVYSIGVAANFINKTGSTPFNVPFDQAIIIGRIISALLTLALVYLIYKCALSLKNQNAAILAFIFSTTSVAFIEFSHFGTFEIWLSFFYLLTTYLLLRFMENNKSLYFVLASILFGVCLGLKLSSLAFLPVPFYVVVIAALNEKRIKSRIFTFIKLSLVFIFFSTAFYLITSPFNFIDQVSFLNSMKYESGVAMGNLPVFYTGEFYNQIPILFQLHKILPFLINPLLTLIFIPAIIFVTYKGIEDKNRKLGLFIISFFCLFISNSILFAKWTRYIVPSIPFLYILIAVFLTDIFKDRKILRYSFLFFAAAGILFSFSFIKTVRIDQSPTLSALNFAKKNIPSDSKIVSEVYDLGIVPFNSSFHNISLFNFYDLDNGNAQRGLLPGVLKDSDYIILPSQRIYQSRVSNPDNFPNGYKFYSDLFSNKTSYIKIYQTPCDLFCKIIYMDDPVFGVEQTANVFDRPQVYIFKNTKQ